MTSYKLNYSRVRLSKTSKRPMKRFKITKLVPSYVIFVVLKEILYFACSTGLEIRYKIQLKVTNNDL